MHCPLKISVESNTSPEKIQQDETNEEEPEKAEKILGKKKKKSQGDYKISMPRYNYHHFEFEMAI